MNGYKVDDTVHTMSVTKSIVSLLVGIAIEQGLIGSVDDYVLDYFPEYKIKRGEKTIQKVTLKNLLTMTAPYKYKSELGQKYVFRKIGALPLWTFWVADAA